MYIFWFLYLYIEYKNDRLEKVVYPTGIPANELVEILNLADKKKIDLRVTVQTPTLWGWVGIGIIVVVIIGIGVIFAKLGRR